MNSALQDGVGPDLAHEDILVPSFAAAIFVLAEDQTLIHRNGAGQALLSDNDGVAVENSRLRFWHTSAQDALTRAIRAEVCGQAQADAPREWLARRPSGKAPLIVMRAAARGGREAKLALFVVGAETAAASLMPLRLQRLFGLTPSEADIAMGISCGLALQDMAISRRTTVGTVRAHLKGAFAKMGVRRQVELAVLVSKLSLLAPRSAEMYVTLGPFDTDGVPASPLTSVVTTVSESSQIIG